MLRFLLIAAIAVIVVVHLLRRFRDEPLARGPRRHVPGQRELARDPVCGTFVAAGQAVVATRHGETLHFCSQACYRRFLAGGAAATGRTA